MATITGKLVLDEDGALCVKMKLSPANPELYDIPMEELLEEYLEKEIFMKVLPVEPRWEVLEK